MTRDILVLLACFGLAYIVGHSKISLPFRIALTPADSKTGLPFMLMRWFVELIECVACFGFWQGIALVQLSIWAPFGGSFWQNVATGLLVSATNLILGAWCKLI